MYFILWLNEHRMLVVWLLAITLWVGAYVFYFRQLIRNWLMRGRPHSWSVDMVTKKAVARGQEQI